MVPPANAPTSSAAQGWPGHLDTSAANRPASTPAAAGTADVRNTWWILPLIIGRTSARYIGTTTPNITMRFIQATPETPHRAAHHTAGTCTPSHTVWTQRYRRVYPPATITSRHRRMTIS